MASGPAPGGGAARSRRGRGGLGRPERSRYRRGIASPWVVRLTTSRVQRDRRRRRLCLKSGNAVLLRAAPRRSTPHGDRADPGQGGGEGGACLPRPSSTGELRTARPSWPCYHGPYLDSSLPPGEEFVRLWPSVHGARAQAEKTLHGYVDDGADLRLAVAVALNAKTSGSACAIP